MLSCLGRTSEVLKDVILRSSITSDQIRDDRELAILLDAQERFARLQGMALSDCTGILLMLKFCKSTKIPTKLLSAAACEQVSSNAFATTIPPRQVSKRMSSSHGTGSSELHIPQVLILDRITPTPGTDLYVLKRALLRLTVQSRPMSWPTGCSCSVCSNKNTIAKEKEREEHYHRT